MVAASAYLVVRRDDGFGEVFPLQSDQRYTMGRATTNRIVLKDELCSREHAEVYYTDGQCELLVGYEVLVGRTNLVFVHQIDELPDAPVPAAGAARTVVRRMH